MSKPKIIDSDGNEFELPTSFNVRSEPSVRRSSLLETAFAHGAKDVSDGMFAPKQVEVSGKIWTDNDADYNTAWDALAKYLIKENIKLEFRDRQINLLRVLSIEHTYPSIDPNPYGEVSIIFLAIDPFWYSIAEQTEAGAITSSPKSFEFSVGGQMDTWPIITVTTDDNPDFKIEDQDDSDRYLRVEDTDYLNTTEITIDCKTGTITRGNGTDLISGFTGRFLRLLGGGDNKLKYTGENAVIVFKYYNAWI